MMLKELLALQGAELGRIHAVSLYSNPVFIPAPPKTTPLLLLCLRKANKKINNCTNKQVCQEGNSSPLSFPALPSPSRPAGRPSSTWAVRGPREPPQPCAPPHGTVPLRKPGRESWCNPGSQSQRGHGGNMLGSFSSALVMVLAMTVSYSIILPKDFQ